MGWQIGGIAPVRAAVGGDIERQFQTAPDAELVKCVAQIILDDLLGGANDVGDFAIGLAFPNQHRDLSLLGSYPITWLHEIPSALFGTRRSRASRACGHL